MGVARYTVKVERKNRGFLEHKYWWTVDVIPDDQDLDRWDEPKTQYEFKGYGYARSVSEGRKKALKHIAKTQAKIDKGEMFGVVFEDSGTKEDLERRLG